MIILMFARRILRSSAVDLGIRESPAQHWPEKALATISPSSLVGVVIVYTTSV